MSSGACHGFVNWSASRLCSPEQNPTARVKQLTLDCSPRPAGSKRGHMVREDSGEVGRRTPTCAIFVHLKAHKAASTKLDPLSVF